MHARTQQILQFLLVVLNIVPQLFTPGSERLDNVTVDSTTMTCHAVPMGRITLKEASERRLVSSKPRL
jgi:hypothetical protein